MARKKKATAKVTIRLSLDDKAALDGAALTLDREPQWVLGKLAHLAIGEVQLSKDVRTWLRGDTAWDAGLPGDQVALVVVAIGVSTTTSSPQASMVTFLRATSCSRSR